MTLVFLVDVSVDTEDPSPEMPSPIRSPTLRIYHYMILGDSSVGKTTILRRLTKQMVNPEEPPTTELS
jgi:GTPase SAR1 family protein